MVMKKPIKPTKPIDIGLGKMATASEIRKALSAYTQQQSYSKASAEISRSKGTSPSAGTRGSNRKEPVFFKTDGLRSLLGQKTGVINSYIGSTKSASKAEGRASAQQQKREGQARADAEARKKARRGR